MEKSLQQPVSAIVRRPDASLSAGERTFISRVPVRHDLALEQHAAYVAVLRSFGVEVLELPPLIGKPDSTFVEDNALILDEVAILLPMGAEARRSETSSLRGTLETIRPVLSLDQGAKAEGGDMLRVGRRLLVGRSTRTNDAAIEQLRALLEPYDYQVEAVRTRESLHLKTACTALPDGSLWLNPAWIDEADLSGFAIHQIPATEPFSACQLTVAKRVLIASEHVQARRDLEALGFDVIPIEL